MQLDGPGQPLRLVERCLPQPKPYELLIEIAACGVCRTDLHVADGEIPAHYPVVPGHEIVGRILKIGSEVGGFELGERAHVKKHQLNVHWQLETHAHADHLSAASYLQKQSGGKIAIGQHIVTVQQTFGKLFNLGAEFRRDGSDFDKLFADGESFQIGNLKVSVLHVPGHTPACVAYAVGDVIFVGDTLFMPDYGTARADFPGGDARLLYHSAKRILSFPPETRLFMCHDYLPEGRTDYRCETTVEEQCAHNVHIHDGVGEQEFVAMRERRDRTLAMPRLILPSVQINIRAGHLPAPEDNGIVYLKIPLNAV